jgi:hypothetical protein
VIFPLPVNWRGWLDHWLVGTNPHTTPLIHHRQLTTRWHDKILDKKGVVHMKGGEAWPTILPDLSD